MVQELILTSKVVSATLAFAAAYYFLRSYRILRADYLFGLPTGFAFLALSYILSVLTILTALARNLILPPWIHLAIQTYGYSFIAISYIFQGGSERVVLGRSAPATVFSVATIISIITTMILVVPSAIFLPIVNIVEQHFRTANVVILSCILFRLVKTPFRHSERSLIFVVTAFAMIGLSEYSLLIDVLEPNTSALTFGHILSITGLTVLVYRSHSIFARDRSP